MVPPNWRHRAQSYSIWKLETEATLEQNVLDDFMSFTPLHVVCHQRLALCSNSHFENLKCEFRTLQGAKLTFQVQC
jgi:hypothetical protein